MATHSYLNLKLIHCCYACQLPGANKNTYPCAA